MSNLTSPQRPQIADDIVKLKGLEAVRLRPGMYLGSNQHIINRIADEILDNAIDEAMAGLCDQIEITIHADSSITVTDNGSGIPVAISPLEDVSFLEACLTMLYAGRWHRKYRYQISGGMHGVGLKAVQAVSEWLIAEIRRDGYLWRQSYARGVRTSNLVQVRPLGDTESTGTSITFLADTEIFEDIHSEFVFSYDILANRCRQIAHLLPNIALHLVDRRATTLPRETTFRFEGGLETYVNELNRDRVPLHMPVSGMTTVQIDGAEPDRNTVEIEFAFQYTDSLQTTELMFVNTFETPDGGTHLTGLRTALTRTINQQAHKMGYFKPSEIKFTGRATQKGLTAIVSLKHPTPHFEGAFKLRLSNPEVKPMVASTISRIFAEYLEKNPEDAQRIFNNCRAAKSGRSVKLLD